MQQLSNNIKISLLVLQASIDVVGTLVSLQMLVINELLSQLFIVLRLGLSSRFETLHQLLLQFGKGQFHDDGHQEPKEQRQHQHSHIGLEGIDKVEVDVIVPCKNELVQNHQMDQVGAEGDPSNEVEDFRCKDEVEEGMAVSQSRREDSQNKTEKKDWLRKSPVKGHSQLRPMSSCLNIPRQKSYKSHQPKTKPFTPNSDELVLEQELSSSEKQFLPWSLLLFRFQITTFLLLYYVYSIPKISPMRQGVDLPQGFMQRSSMKSPKFPNAARSVKRAIQ